MAMVRVQRYARRSLSPTTLHGPLSRIGQKYPGISGNCAVFAQKLRKALGPEAGYIVISGGDYEYADHVAVWYKGHVLDSDGVSTLKQFKEKWGQPDLNRNDEWYIPEFEFWENVTDEEDELVLKLADEGGLFCIPIDHNELERELRAKIAAVVR